MGSRLILFIPAMLFCGFAPAQSDNAATSGTCPVTVYDEDEGFYGNDALQTAFVPGEPVVFEPGGPGFVDFDGGLGIKWPWIRLIEGRLAVGGRRLDDDAPPARAYLNDGYGTIGFQPVYLVFPTPGCWEITGGVSGRSLTFVVEVEKVGEGPDWRVDGVPDGWHVTTHWNQFGPSPESNGQNWL